MDTKSVRLKIDLMEDNPGVSLVNVCPTCTVVTFGPRRAATRKTVSVPAKMQKNVNMKKGYQVLFLAIKDTVPKQATARPIEQ